MLVLDCSVLMEWIMPDEVTNYAQSVRGAIVQYDIPIMVPTLFFLEAVNVLEVMERRKRMDETLVQNALNLLQQLPVTVDSESSLLPSILRVRQLMRQYTLSSYDASYLELAKRRSLPLSTLDKALRRAAEAEKVFFVM